MTITAAQVKELREQTGAGMLDAKNALVETDGDMEKAAELLRQKGIASAEKKSGRIAAEGQVAAAIVAGGKVGALSEMNSETDFVARGDAFQAMIGELTKYLAEKGASDVEDFLGQPAPSGAGTVKDFIVDRISQIKENISFRRFERFECKGEGLVHSYIHTGGKIGVLVELSCTKGATASNADFQQLAKDISMQIASAAPEFVSRDEIPKDVIDAETRIEMGKEDVQSKPAEMREKIVAGRVSKLLGQRVLLEQPFVKDPGKTITQLLEEIGKSLGDTLGVVRFSRYVLGEGIEKKQVNFAEEVMAQLK